MKKIFALVICLCLFPASAHALATLSSTDIALEVLFFGLYTVDWGQTLDIASREQDGYYEVNPIIGRHPTRGRVNTVFALFAVGQIAGTVLLPSQYKIVGYTLNLRRIWQMSFITVSGACVANNYAIGLHTNF